MAVTGRSQNIYAYRAYFPAAAAYAAVALPLSVWNLTGGMGYPPGLATGLYHAHEMLFGFALAVVSGFLLGPLPRRQLMGLFTLWLAARVAFLAGPGTAASLALNAIYPVALAYTVAPKFLGAAKKLRNQAFAPVLIALCAAAVVFQLAGGFGAFWLQPLAVVEAVLLLAMLMLFMGGRIIAPAAAGQMNKQGEHLEARVQPRIEGALLVAMTVAILALPLDPTRRVAAVALLAAGLLAAVRLWRWRLWRCRQRPDLLCLGAGYAWLPVGLVIVAGALLADGNYRTALHAFTIGALGALSVGVMARTRLQRAKLEVANRPHVWVATGLVSLAAALRLLAESLPWLSYAQALWIGAGLWSLAFLLLLQLFVSTPAQRLP